LRRAPRDSVARYPRYGVRLSRPEGQTTIGTDATPLFPVHERQPSSKAWPADETQSFGVWQSKVRVHRTQLRAASLATPVHHARRASSERGRSSSPSV